MLPWLVVISDLRLDLNPMFPLNPQVIFRCLPFVKTKVPSTARLPVPLTQVPSKAARNQFLGNNRNVMKAKPLAASGVTPAGVSGWEPPAHSGETSGPLETTKPQDTATIGNVEPAGKLAVPRCHPPTTRVAGGANEDTIAKTPGRMATTRGPQGRRIGNDSRKDNAMEAMMSGAIGEVILNTKEPLQQKDETAGDYGTISRKFATFPRQMDEMVGPVGTILHKTEVGPTAHRSATIVENGNRESMIYEAQSSMTKSAKVGVAMAKSSSLTTALAKATTVGQELAHLNDFRCRRSAPRTARTSVDQRDLI